MRLATAAVCVPVILGLLYRAPPWAFYLLVAPVALVGLRELFAMTHPGDPISQAVGVVVAAVASAAVYFRGDDARYLVTVLLVVPMVGPLFTLVRLGPMETAALRVCALGFGPLFVVVPLTLLALMRRTLGDVGSGAVFLCLGLAWFADTSAYFAGRFLGRRKLYEAVSPKKTRRGERSAAPPPPPPPLGSVVWALLGSVLVSAGQFAGGPRRPAGARRRGPWASGRPRRIRAETFDRHQRFGRHRARPRRRSRPRRRPAHDVDRGILVHAVDRPGS